MGNNVLPIIVIAENSFDLWITDIAFLIYFVIADKLHRDKQFLMHSCTQ